MYTYTYTYKKMVRIYFIYKITWSIQVSKILLRKLTKSFCFFFTENSVDFWFKYGELNMSKNISL